MAFDALSDRLKLVANGSLAICRRNWGSNGLRKEEPIDPKIGWRPTFYMRANRVLIVAIEVNDFLFPEALKVAAHDIEHYDFPIAVYQACSLDVYQKDPRLARVKTLREHGFGIITVDEEGNAEIQTRADSLAQHIPPNRLDAELRVLTPRLKVKFNAAHATYQGNVGQGLQEAGQIIEALIKCIAVQAEAARIVSAGVSKGSTADTIDDLYSNGAFRNFRATLGGARSFVRSYRNVASHPAMTPKQVTVKVRKCKAGFFDALKIAGELRTLIQDLGYRVNIQ